MITCNSRSPKQGLNIIQRLYQQNPTHQGIISSLINAYIRFGHHDEAINLINKIPKDRVDNQNLKWRAWVAYKQSNIPLAKQLYQEVINKSIHMEICSPIHQFKKHSTKEININKDDIALISVTHNEMIRLPFFLKHYRKLGITQFFFIDNNSNDGSLEFLSSQPDCHVFWTDDSYNESGSGIRWVHHILDNYIPKNQWCIHVDADEFLAYPHFEYHKLTKLTQYLDKYDYEAVSSFMLDIFPKDINSQLAITSNDDLLELSPYFYNNYELHHQGDAPYINPVGGIFRYYNICDRRVKTSLFKNNEQFRFLSSTHSTTPVKISDISSTYFHLKMLGDFHKKALNEQNRKEHAGGGRAYTQYAKIYDSFSDTNFNFATLPKTTKYQNSQQLIDLELIKTSKKWEYFIQGKSPKTPFEGLSILEKLHQKHPNNDVIRNNLINAYFRLNQPNLATKIIKKEPLNPHNMQSLKHHAYMAHQEGNISQELQYWLAIFHKSLEFLCEKERNYILSQATTDKQKINLCKENFYVLFNYANYSLPAQLQELLGTKITNIVLIANNREITLNCLKKNIEDDDLIICFNFSIFMNFYQHFPNNTKLLCFRKVDDTNHHFFGLPEASISNRSSIDVDFNKTYELIRQNSTYLLFDEHLPHTLNLPKDIYQKIYNPRFTGLLFQFHKIFNYLKPIDSYFNYVTLPSSGFMVLKYFYYTRLHLLMNGKPSFNIKLLGFNFTNNSFYSTYGVHNWQYERSQLENLPDSITRIIVP